MFQFNIVSWSTHERWVPFTYDLSIYLDMHIFFDFSLTVKAAPHECLNRTGLP